MSSRYLEAFNRIEKWLREITKSSDGISFSQLVNKASDRIPPFSKHGDSLKSLANFRNSLVHEHEHGKRLAIPTEYAIQLLQKIESQFISPKPLFSFASKPVEFCQITDSVSVAIKKMFTGQYSQMPLKNEKECCGLLTSDTVSRWLSTQLVDHNSLAIDTQIAEVMKCRDELDHWTFISKKASFLDGIEQFESFLRKGKTLEALLITENGKANETILGILTVYDLPKLYAQFD